MRWLRKQHDQSCNKTLEQLEVKDPKGYWSSLKTFAGQGKSEQKLPSEMKEGLALVGGIAALNKWKEGFQQLGKPQQADDPRFDKEFYHESHTLVTRWTQERTEGSDDLDGVITMEEVDKAIKLLRRGKAAGVDGAVNEILKYAGPEMTRSLWVLFNTLFEGASTAGLDERTRRPHLQGRRQAHRGQLPWHHLAQCCGQVVQ